MRSTVKVKLVQGCGEWEKPSEILFTLGIFGGKKIEISNQLSQIGAFNQEKLNFRCFFAIFGCFKNYLRGVFFGIGPKL